MARNVAVAVTMLLGMTAAVQAKEAKDSTLAELYGDGVHAYHSGDFKDAFSSLNQAIKQGSKDPRCYIYRGLAYIKLGRPDEAKADFKKGGELATTPAGKLVAVSKALSRIQGKVRLQIEAARRKARVDARRIRVNKERARYGRLNDAETKGQVLVPSKPKRTKLVVPSGTKKDPSNPFQGGVAAGTSVATPITAVAAGTDVAAGAAAAQAVGPAAKAPMPVAKKPVASGVGGPGIAKPGVTKPATQTTSDVKETAVTRGFFNFFRKKAQKATAGATGALGNAMKGIPGVPGMRRGPVGGPPATGKKFKGNKDAPDPFNDDLKKKKKK